LTTLEHPEVVKSLTLGEPPVMSLLQYIPDGEKLGNDFAMRALVPSAEAFKNNNDKKAVEIFVGGVLNDSLFFSNMPKEAQNLMTDNITELKGIAFTENLFPPLSCEDINKIKTPTLLIKGDRSPKILAAIIDELANCIDENELKALSNSSHGLEFENPEEFNKIVLEFIGKH
jgi:pimeloyl-ACP methyl ester carboxylesterase